jgi:leukotriene-A4 hydrolase
MQVEIFYQTHPEASATQWLEPALTAGKEHPYLFTQCQAIHARSLLPCQDAPGNKVGLIDHERLCAVFVDAFARDDCWC